MSDKLHSLSDAYVRIALSEEDATRSVALILARSFKAGKQNSIHSPRRVSDAITFVRDHHNSLRRYATHNLDQARSDPALKGRPKVDATLRVGPLHLG